MKCLENLSALFSSQNLPIFLLPTGDLRTISDEVVNRFSRNVIIQFEKAQSYQFSLQELYPMRKSILANKELFPDDIEQLCDYLRRLLAFPIASQKSAKKYKSGF